MSEEKLLYTLEEVLAKPDPTWLIRHILPSPGLSLLYGPSGFGKSFIALDWALSVASGAAWLGKFPIDSPGATIYIACEGTGGLKRRISTWLAHHPDAKPDAISFCLKSVDIYEEDERNRLLDALDELYPCHPQTEEEATMELITPLRLIVIDTVARMYQGDDENDNAQMSAFIAAVEDFATEHGATVLLVHHSAKASSKNERGGGALRGAMDACYECKGTKKDGKLVKATLTCNKMKDAEELTVKMEMEEYDLRDLRRDEEGKVRRCGAFTLIEDGFEDEDKDEDTNTGDTTDPVGILRQYPKGLTFTVWRELAEQAPATFNRTRARLIESGLVVKRDDLYFVKSGNYAKGLKG